MKTRLLFVAATLLVLHATAQTAGIRRGSVDVEITQAGQTTSAIYKDGAGIGTDLDGANFGSFAVGDMVTLSDPYLFSFKNGTCDVTAAEAEVSIAPTGLPFLSQSLGTISFAIQQDCGDPGARFTAEGGGCIAGDQEWGEPAATLSFDPAAEAAAAGVPFTDFDITVAWSVTTQGAGCTPVDNPRIATASASITVPFPVELEYFEAAPSPLGAELTWATASEIDNAGFYVERRGSRTDSWQDIGFVPAQSSELSRRLYAYTDADAPAGTSYYRLRQVDLDGDFEHSDERAVELAPDAQTVALAPNPAAYFTVLNNPLAHAQRFSLVGATGQVLRTVEIAAGSRRRLDLTDLAAGTYLVQGEQGSEQLVVRR